ncbi:MAG: hypothetical protein R3A52_28375 [Polyangiales bacterium]
MGKTTDQVLRAVTQRVLDSFTGQGALFTALDHQRREGHAPRRAPPRGRPVVRDLYERGAMGEYTQTLIDVLADGHKQAQAYLYHLYEHDASLYDETMRTQLAIPPVSVSTDVNDDKNLDGHSVEAPVLVGRDGRARVPRQLLLNAGVSGDVILARAESSPPRVVLEDNGDDFDDESDPSTASIEYEHPSLLHVPRSLLKSFPSGAKLVARVLPGRVDLVEA